MLTFEERQYVRKRRSDIQSAKEHDARMLKIRAVDGGIINLGGGSRPKDEQTSGYPINHLPND